MAIKGFFDFCRAEGKDVPMRVARALRRLADATTQANYVLAGPASGTGRPDFRSLSGLSGPASLLYVNTTIPGGNTVSGTVAETAFSSTYTIPANSLAVGSVVRHKCWGTWGPGAVAASIVLKVKWGSTVLGTATSGSINSNATHGWNLALDAVCTAIGVGGTVEAQGRTLIEPAVLANQEILQMTNTSPITINTTTGQAITVTVTLSNAVSESITLRIMSVDTALATSTS